MVGQQLFKKNRFCMHTIIMQTEQQTSAYIATIIIILTIVQKCVRKLIMYT